MTGTGIETSRQTGAHRLTMTSDHLSEMIEHVRSWYPMEGCGLLATSGEQVTRVYPGTNIARSETFYEMDPKEVLAAMQDIDDRGDRLGAIFHSHPTTPSWPSPTDRDLIFDPDVFMIIISLAEADPVVRAFRDNGEVSEVPIILASNPEPGGQP
jgi:[CysO sulfur-carrier protein]-S-L-cysteine hydrolase